MFKAIRNIFRRKLRSALTIFGITIGIFTLIVMGSMAEKINLLIDGGTKYYTGKVIVSDKKSSMMAAQPLSIKKIKDVKKVDGVEAAFAQNGLLLNPDSTTSFGIPKMIIAQDVGANNYEKKRWDFGMAQGRELTARDDHKAVIGSDLVKDLKAKVGKTIKIRGQKFEVIGIMDKTLTAPDSEVLIPLKNAQELMVNDYPEAIRKTIDKNDITSQIIVYPKKGVNVEKLAKRIETKVKNVSSMGPSGFKKSIGQVSVIFSLIMFGVAAISLLVGGMSVINTMMMSISERTREIGIKKAIGASKTKIVYEFVVEAAFIGAFGGLLGIVLGWLTTIGANAAMASSGVVLFLLTSRLVIGSMAFAICLGALAGLYPSWHAALMNPVEALRYE